MVDVAALHMWNQKYGPQVIFDCNAKNVQQYSEMTLLNLYNKVTSASQIFYRKHKYTTHQQIPLPTTGPHPHRIDRGGQQVFPLWLLVLFLLLVGAVLLHGFPAGEMDDPARSLFSLLLLLLFSLVQLPQLHALKVLSWVWTLCLGHKKKKKKTVCLISWTI